MTKVEISPADIRKGDLIRFERDSTIFSYNAIEYVATTDNQAWNGIVHGKHYLLERPEQPFKVGTVVQGKDGVDPSRIWVRTGVGWVVAPRQDKSSQKVMNSVLSDSKVTEYIGRGLMETLSEPA